MKIKFAIVIFGILLTGCVGASVLGGTKCQQGVCINAQIGEPVKFNEPVALTITVTSERDITNLGVSLYRDPDTVVEGPQNWEPSTKNRLVWEGGASWRVDVKANEPSVFSRTLRFPAEERLFFIGFTASTPSFRVEDSLRIYITRVGGTVYYSGTPIPITPGPVPTSPPALRTLLAQPTATRTPRRIPTPTRRPYP